MTQISIPRPKRTEKGRIVGEFYPLQREELLALKNSGLARGPFYVHLCLRYENPWCDRPFKISPKAFCERWQVSESKFYRSISELKRLEILQWESTDVFFCWSTPHSGSELPIVGVTPHSGSETPHSGSETPHSGSETPHSGNLDELEPLSSNSFSNGGSQTIQTNSDPNIFSDKGGNEKSQELIQNSCTALLDKPESSGQANQIAHVEKSSVVLLDPFFNRRPKPQEIEWDWVPEGEWKVDGKLDANFVDWHARRWMQKYGALDIHEARKNVRAYHRNDPRRLADDWQEYHEATLHKATNIAVRQSNGINVPSQEKEAIAKHQAALRPSDKSVVRSQYEEVKQYIPCVEHEKFSMFSATEVHMIAAEKDIDWDALEQQTQDWEQEQIQAPEDADNPQAYTLRSASSSDKEYWARVYAARSQDVEKSVEVFASSPVKDVIAKIASSMSMPKEKMKCATNDLEQLNSWLQDPTEVLRKEAVRIAKLRGYQIELDETGNPMRISEPDF